MSHLLLFFSVLCFQVFSLNLHAADQVRMVTTSPNVEVYDSPSFSGKVIGTLKMQTVVQVNSKKVVGPDGIGAFYAFKASNGKIAYVNDSLLVVAPPVKLQPQEKKTVVAHKPAPVVAPPKPVAVVPAPKPVVQVPVAQKPVAATPPPPPVVVVPPVEVPEKTVARAPEPEPVAVHSPSPVQTKTVIESSYSSRTALVGVNFGMIDYAEKYQSTRYQASRMALGLRYQSFFANSRNWGTEGNFLFSPGAPKFLVDAGAKGSSEGYLAIGDYQAVGRFTIANNIQAKVGGGIALINSKFSTTVINDPYSSASTRAGATLNAGISYTRPAFTFTFDLRQFVENESYMGTQVSFLFPL